MLKKKISVQEVTQTIRSVTGGECPGESAAISNTQYDVAIFAPKVAIKPARERYPRMSGASTRQVMAADEYMARMRIMGEASARREIELSSVLMWSPKAHRTAMDVVAITAVKMAEKTAIRTCRIT